MLTERQKLILSLIIQYSTKFGQPVGSKTLMDENVQASSATIRNDMKVLEQLGLIQKTHSSSGRIPSNTGYRYYVDYLLKPEKVRKNETELIRSSLLQDVHEINDIFRRSAEILSNLTSYTVFSLGPEIKDRKLTGFKMIPLNDRQILAIVVTDKGNVESQVFAIPSNMSVADLGKMVEIIQERLMEQPLIAVYHKLRTEIPMVLHRYFQSTEGVLALLEAIMAQAFENRIFVSGKMNFLNFDELADPSQVKLLYSFLQDSDELNQLLMPHDTEIHTRIGSELGHDLLDHFSVVQANVEIEGHGQGTIALLGPTSMSYDKIFGLLQTFQAEMTKALNDYYRSLDLPKG